MATDFIDFIGTMFIGNSSLAEAETFKFLNPGAVAAGVSPANFKTAAGDRCPPEKR
jgi:hypothetical protein